MEEICSRIKVIFQGGILSDSQISEGLENTWVLLKPQQQKTISDFTSYILQLFHLNESCPGGVVLSMDGFVLPPFESTSILKDKDVISVKRRLGTSGPLLLANEEFNKEMRSYESEEPKGNKKDEFCATFHLMDKFGGDEICKNRKVGGKRKQGTLAIECNEAPLESQPLLLANEEFTEENGKDEKVHGSSSLNDKLDEGATSKKRKASEKLHSSKKKKHHSEVEEPDIDAQAEHTDKAQLVLKRKKSSSHKKQKKSDSIEKDDAGTSEDNVIAPVTKMKKKHRSVAEEPDIVAQTEHTEKGQLVSKRKKNNIHKKQKIPNSNEKDDAGTSEDNIIAPVTNMNGNLLETEKDNVETTAMSEETPKRRSRNARRKSIKRQWLREMAKIQTANTDSQSEAIKNWREMQSNSVREEPAGRQNGHKNWKEMQSKSVREETAGRSNGHKNWKEIQSRSCRDDAIGHPNGHKSSADIHSESYKNWKEMQSKSGREDSTDLPNRHENWKEMQFKSVTEDAADLPNGHSNWKETQSKIRREETTVQPNRHGQSTSERREASYQLKGLLHSVELPANDMVKDAKEHIESDAKNNPRDKPNQDEDSDDETEVVPVEIRPGHFRFERLGKERTMEPNQLNAVESFRWNGITSKRKGQKWGTEKSSFTQRNEVNYSNREQSEMPNAKMFNHSNEPFDFTKLPFLSGSLKQGDVIAYRFLELSSTWTPELSSYRVGEVSSYDSQLGVVSLMPVPEFPILCKKSDGDDESSMQPVANYKEDGSLEIEFSALAEVRILQHKMRVPVSSSGGVAGDDSTLLTVTADVQTPAPIPPDNKDLINDSEEMHSIIIEDNNVDPWEQISEALNAKKQQLSQETNCDRESSGKTWSYKSLRGSALGPTMALLRSKNQI
ncbi:unnamed protein product [Cuscuta europaea]|uniref:Coilin n=1 Tax=Cuscuta europaea TaxID=41803 RepID=A0A9P0ZW30_CUSEU|nr:unnamed protein product [Cuscuta europaea]